MPFRLYLLKSRKLKSLSKEEENHNILKQHFLNLNLQKGVEIKLQKRQLLANATVKVETYMAEKLYLSCIQICAPFVCQPNTFLPTNEEMVKG